MASKLKTSDKRVVLLNYVRTAPIFQKNLEELSGKLLDQRRNKIFYLLEDCNIMDKSH